MVTSAPCGQRLLGIGGDDVIGLIAFKLDAGDVEGSHGIADKAELGHQIFRSRRALGLVLIIDLVAEGVALGIENHRHMGRGDANDALDHRPAISFQSMLQKPATAPTGRPSLLRVSGGRA